MRPSRHQWDAVSTNWLRLTFGKAVYINIRKWCLTCLICKVSARIFLRRRLFFFHFDAPAVLPYWCAACQVGLILEEAYPLNACIHLPWWSSQLTCWFQNQHGGKHEFRTPVFQMILNAANNVQQEKPHFYQKPLQTMNNLIGLLQISFPALFKTIHQMAFPVGTAWLQHLEHAQAPGRGKRCIDFKRQLLNLPEPQRGLSRWVGMEDQHHVMSFRETMPGTTLYAKWGFLHITAVRPSQILHDSLFLSIV